MESAENNKPAKSAIKTTSWQLGIILIFLGFLGSNIHTFPIEDIAALLSTVGLVFVVIDVGRKLYKVFKKTY